MHAVLCSQTRLQRVRLQANFQEAYVRRALRVVAKQRAAYHQRRYRFALAGMLPLCPLMVSPLPNLPLYYLGYRVYSHNTAHVGARATLQLLDAHSARSKDKLRDAIEELRKEGHAPRDGSWAAELVASGGDESAANAEKASQSAKLVLEGNDELASLTDPGRKCASRLAPLSLAGPLCLQRPPGLDSPRSLKRNASLITSVCALQSQRDAVG